MWLDVISRLFHFWPLGTSSIWLLHRFDIILALFDCCLAFWYDTISRLPWYLSCPRHEISYFSEEPWSLLVRTGVQRKQSRHQECLVLWIIIFRTFLWVELENVCRTDSFYSNSGLQSFNSPSSILHLYFLSPMLKILAFYDIRKIIHLAYSTGHSEKSQNNSISATATNTMIKNSLFSVLFVLRMYLSRDVQSHNCAAWKSLWIVPFHVIMTMTSYTFKLLCLTLPWIFMEYF